MALQVGPLPRADDRDFDVLAAGECSVDVAGRVVTPAPPGGKGRLADLEVHVGGQAATAAVAASRLGWRAAWAGVTGDDGWGRQIRDALALERVQVHAPERAGVPSRAAMIAVDARSGERTVLESRDPRLDMTEAEVIAMASLAARARVLIVDATDLAMAVAVARSGRAAGVPVIVDVDRSEPDVAPLLAAATFLVLPLGFAPAFTGLAGEGAALHAIRDRFGSELAVTTLGDEGSLAVTSGGVEVRTPAVAVEAVDTTGAGDAFRGGLAAALLEAGAEGDPAWLLRFANAVAALSCRRAGAQAGLPRRPEIEPYL